MLGIRDNYKVMTKLLIFQRVEEYEISIEPSSVH